MAIVFSIKKPLSKLSFCKSLQKQLTATHPSCTTGLNGEPDRKYVGAIVVTLLNASRGDCQKTIHRGYAASHLAKQHVSIATGLQKGRPEKADFCQFRHTAKGPMPFRPTFSEESVAEASGPAVSTEQHSLPITTIFYEARNSIFQS